MITQPHLESFIMKGNFIIMHDNVHHVTWRLAVIEDLVLGGDGLVQEANLRTTNRTTSRPITRLYLLELNVKQTLDDDDPKTR